MKLLTFVFALILSIGAATMAQDAGKITQESFDSAMLGRAVDYNIYLPAAYQNSSARYPVIYLLHGRGDSMAGWLNAKNDLDALIASGAVPPMIAVMPDFPSSDRAGYYVDSQYTGSAAPAAEPVETAFFSELIPHIDATYRTVAARDGRLVGGYSMGGYGALRYSLAHPDMFVGALVLSPAVYIPLPPVDSSTREFGAFGVGDSLFDPQVYTDLNYPALLPAFGQTGLGLSMFIAVGDDEWKNERPEDMLHDLDLEAHMVFNHVVRVPSIRSEFRVYDGGHDWDVWQRGFNEGLLFLSRALRSGDDDDTSRILPLDDLTGSDGGDFAGGIAQGADGSTYIALGAGGPVNGQPHAGELDIAVIKRAPDGSALWTRQFGSPANDRPYGLALDLQGDVIVAGYTRGDLDGAHPSGASDDAFVVKLNADGDVVWTLQFGDAAQADRVYGLTLGDDGMIFVTGYTKGIVSGELVGDKDVFVAGITPDGEIAWIDQFGSPGEDKGYAVATDGLRVYSAGVLATDAGGLDAHVTAHTVDGEFLWTQSFGTPDWDEAQGVAVSSDGAVYVTGFVAGALDDNVFRGDKDIFTAAFTPDGTQVWSAQLGTAGNDKGASLIVGSLGDLIVAGFTTEGAGRTLGGFDVLMLRYDANGKPRGVLQLGTASDDGADEYAEKNLFISLAGESALLSGLSGADVFIKTVQLYR